MHLFGHSCHFVAQIYTHHYEIIPTGYVLMFWLGGCILSNQTGMILSSLYWKFHNNEGLSLYCVNLLLSKWLELITTMHSNTKRSHWKSERESFFFWIVTFMVCCLYVWMASTRAVTLPVKLINDLLCTPLFPLWFWFIYSYFLSL